MEDLKATIRAKATQSFADNPLTHEVEGLEGAELENQVEKAVGHSMDLLKERAKTLPKDKLGTLSPEEYAVLFQQIPFVPNLISEEAIKELWEI